MALPEFPQPGVGVDIVHFGLVFECICITCKHQKGGRVSYPHSAYSRTRHSENFLSSLGLITVKHIKNI